MRWRVSGGPRRSLGWIPFKASAIRYRNGPVIFAGVALSLWDSYGLSKYELGAENISEDACGGWYLNTTIQVEKAPKSGTGPVRQSVGIDLGLKDFAATSDGRVIAKDRHYRRLEGELGKAQGARKKARVRARHAKIKNSRKDPLHKLSTVLVKEYGAIFIGNVNASALDRTRMAKSVLDAGWSRFRTVLRYKGDHAGVWFEEVATQTCNCRNRRTGPKGREGLGIKEWACTECGAYHHRDINLAVNILAAVDGGLNPRKSGGVT